MAVKRSKLIDVCPGQYKIVPAAKVGPFAALLIPREERPISDDARFQAVQTRRDGTPGLSPGELRPVDEFANLLTHGLGFILSILASIALMKIALERQETATILACGVYCFSLVGLYAASTLSHAFYDLTWRRFFRMLDQAFIYVLIAGSFTPFAVIFLGRGKPSLLLTAMWMLAFFGVLLVLRVRNLPSAAKVTYGVLGWLPIISLETFMHHAPFAMIVWIIAGGLFYSSGTVFLLFDQQVRYLHALWHTFVIAGSACHYIAILLLVTLM